MLVCCENIQAGKESCFNLVDLVSTHLHYSIEGSRFLTVMSYITLILPNHRINSVSFIGWVSNLIGVKMCNGGLTEHLTGAFWRGLANSEPPSDVCLDILTHARYWGPSLTFSKWFETVKKRVKLKCLRWAFCICSVTKASFVWKHPNCFNLWDLFSTLQAVMTTSL